MRKKEEEKRKKEKKEITTGNKSRGGGGGGGGGYQPWTFSLEDHSDHHATFFVSFSYIYIWHVKYQLVQTPWGPALLVFGTCVSQFLGHCPTH